MSSLRWRQLDQIVAGGLQLSGEERLSFVTRACGGDESLRTDILPLLAAADESGEFMARPALDRLAEAIGQHGWSVRTGQKLGAYTIDRLLGAGGAGEVWRARDERLGRNVAVKFMLPHFSDDSERMRRFADEARAAGALNH